MSDNIERGKRVIDAFAQAIEAEDGMHVSTIIEILISLMGSCILEIEKEEHKLMCIDFIKQRLIDVINDKNIPKRMSEEP